MPACIEWGEERHQECTQTRDDGYRDCCTWAPCSWFCNAWVWVSNVVCVGWTWISTAVCVVWDVVTTVVNAVVVTLESTLGWLMSALAFVFELVLAIPVVGALLRWVFSLVTHVVATVVGLGDALLGLIGIRPEKSCVSAP